MTPNPILGILFHAIGGFAAGSFYAPLKRVRGWHWESFWLVMGLAAWLAAPWIAGFLTIPDLIGTLRDSPRDALLWAVVFGMLWGFGNLTFGLAVRYLGMALGYGIALGLCMVFGTLEPPYRDGKLGALLETPSGRLVIAGVVVCLLGIAICAWAGIRREREAGETVIDSSAQRSSALWGYLIAICAGVLSACFAIGLNRGAPIAEVALAKGAADVYKNNAVTVVVVFGGLITNVASCLVMNFRNHSYSDYLSGDVAAQSRNYFLSLTGGVIWYLQFFFYGMGQTKLGKQYEFASWAIHMAFIIMFSNLWGVVFREWRGTSRETKAIVWAGILTLLASTAVFGYASWLAPTTL
jgi:L-rhamnose-H+ transport protein